MVAFNDLTPEMRLELFERLVKNHEEIADSVSALASSVKKLGEILNSAALLTKDVQANASFIQRIVRIWERFGYNGEVY